MVLTRSHCLIRPRVWLDFSSFHKWSLFHSCQCTLASRPNLMYSVWSVVGPIHEPKYECLLEVYKSTFSKNWLFTSLESLVIFRDCKNDGLLKDWSEFNGNEFDRLYTIKCSNKDASEGFIRYERTQINLAWTGRLFLVITEYSWNLVNKQQKWKASSKFIKRRGACLAIK